MINNYTFPIGSREQALPIFVKGAGAIDPQFHVKRENGYAYDQLLFCTGGAGKVIFSGEEHMITENMCIFLPRKNPHEYYALGDKWEIKWVCFDGDGLPSLLERLEFTSPFICNILKDTGYELDIRHLYRSIIDDEVFGGFTASALLYGLLIKVYKSSNSSNGVPRSQKNIVIANTLEYIDNNYYLPITIEILAELSGVTAQHLCRVFKETLDIRPFEYISRKRVQEAKKLLFETDESINEISNRVGYNDCSYFSSVFKKIEGTTPSDFRTLNQAAKYKGKQP